MRTLPVWFVNWVEPHLYNVLPLKGKQKMSSVFALVWINSQVGNLSAPSCTQGLIPGKGILKGVS